MVASDASKGELSEAMDSMIEEVRLKSHVQFLCLFACVFLRALQTFIGSQFVLERRNF